MPDTHTGLTAQWRWAAHVRTCTVDEQIVLLDLKRNRYMGIGDKSRQRLLAAIAGQACDAATGSDAGPTAELAALLRPLVQQGLLVPGTTASPPVVTLPQATRSLEAHEDLSAMGTGAADIVRFLRVAVAARLCLRWRSLYAIANQVSSRRRRRSVEPAQAPSQTLDSAVAGFEKLRPLIFTARDQCLFDSLALIELLATRGHHPHWVLGVKTHPFRAHAWVQQGDTVLNDRHEHVRRFQPILVA